ncbi:DUF5348 domain-containing protein [Paenibacillus fonticola]|uniref:DUF5348 domain-containing protein n=1 Tax=Paenibacillus fonticola TaxID=379896 RepID=UPI00035DE206|nr:DUF5348 domain-containing protein [Paenibacillus fonticola]
MGNYYTLKYDKNEDTWRAITEANRKFSMHCGDIFHINMGKIQLPCRLEMDSDWYAICESVRFRLHPKEEYKIILY